MTAVTATPAFRSTPLHLWVVGVLALLWNAFGAFDYSMSHLQGDAYFRSAGMSPAQIAKFHTMPAWMELFWALGVWGAVAGAVLLLMRSRWAYPVLLASLLGAVVSLLRATFLAGVPRGPQAPDAVTTAIVVIAALLAWYAVAMRKRGVLA